MKTYSSLCRILPQSLLIVNTTTIAQANDVLTRGCHWLGQCSILIHNKWATGHNTIMSWQANGSIKVNNLHVRCAISFLTNVHSRDVIFHRVKIVITLPRHADRIAECEKIRHMIEYFGCIYKIKHSVAFSSQANYTHRAAADFRRS
jgi:hypothetical protein